ncbi:hypothetical protein ABB37_06791 [Leptomonas pyrrhocoris]|uniref:Uncharacterized protein n=1 Tax=Leptomonas pyrrhocoris TaxID=157538 RepID=A0A0M9FXC9_LEPPY|nr:hypothetical protein ABB37_06791 [Leptomonas pyrrhocoris]XP_015656490.1 hypothetical protein ABB37_06791 [Leptomonas pyrrhocoris]KPA78050.1 hypothetical protein ABB37_06791 [Leptomonas pyrrhocoris]KPA78051.1 hypothetical protein ABB37_06791 [Leptomonas pyrrhocoris]|eukprot:XP_015656489.1 hypothetical protein ABB37_06791 [Leptomonas pyrrhocoris]
MSSREQSPEIVFRDENSAFSVLSNSQRSAKASVSKSCEGSGATRHVDAENDGVHATAEDLSTPNGKPARTSALNSSMKSDSQVPLPTVSQLRMSASRNNGTASEARASTTAASRTNNNGHEHTTSAARNSTAAAPPTPTSAGRPPAVPPLPLQPPQQPPPRQHQPSVARSALKAPSVSLPRATMSLNGGRRTGGGSKAFMPKVATTAPNYAAYASDVAKYLKEVARRRDEAAALRLLPSAQLLEQTTLLEQAAHEQIVQQQLLAFMQITHKKKEAEAKMKEQQTTKSYKAKFEEQKQQQKEEMMMQKASVTANTKETEAELKEKLKLVVSLQPRLNVVSAVMAQIEDPASDCALLGDLMQEDKQLQKALKGDARYNKSKTADVDGGAAPYWWKQCVCASFNVAAILKQEPCRASVVEVSIPTKVAADKKVVVVKDAEGGVVAWAHTRTGPDTSALVEAFLESKPAVAELPAAAYKGVIWPKDESVEVLRAAKGPKSATAAIAPEVITILSYKEVGSFELPKKDVVAMGEAAS